MTIKETLKTIIDKYPAISARYISETAEYRVNFRRGVESSAYYTNDSEDAIGTARAMQSEWNRDEHERYGGV